MDLGSLIDKLIDLKLEKHRLASIPIADYQTGKKIADDLAVIGCEEKKIIREINNSKTQEFIHGGPG